MVNIKNVIDKYRILKSMNEVLISNFESFDNEVKSIFESEQAVEDLVGEKKESGEIFEEDVFGTFKISEGMRKTMLLEYKSISKACHPDSSGTQVLNIFFIRAADAKKEENIFEILEISNTIFGKTSFGLSSKDKKNMIEYLEREISSVKSNRLWSWESMSEEDKKSEVLKTLNIIIKK